MKLAGRGSLILICSLLLLQGCDFLLTWRLLSGACPDIYEANPLAAALLDRFGWASLAWLKTGTSCLVVGAVLLVARRRPVLAGRLMGGMCVVMAGVVGYSSWLLLRPADPLVQDISTMNQEKVVLDSQLLGVGRFARKRKLICSDVLTGRIALAAGMKKLHACLLEEIPRLNPTVRAFLPATDRPTEVAAFLYFHASRLVDEGAAHPGQLAILRRQVSKRYPAATLVNAWQVATTDQLPWVEAREVVAKVEDSAS
jgi:hypothetical protein